jgi:hypothetical protein
VIRNTKYLNKEYLIVDTELQIMENGEILYVPVHIQANISKLPPTQHYTAYKAVNYLYNHTTIVGKPKVTTSKPWWKFWSK